MVTYRFPMLVDVPREFHDAEEARLFCAAIEEAVGDWWDELSVSNAVDIEPSEVRVLQPEKVG